MATAARDELRQILHGRCDAIAANWYRAIAPTGFTSLGPPALRRQFAALTEQVVDALLTEPLDRAQAREVGGALARLNFVHPDALSRTQEALAHELLAGLSAEQTLALAPDLTVLLGEVAAGMMARTRTMILDEQEAVRAALFNAYQAAETGRRASEERLHTVIANAPIVLFAVDRAGVLTFCEGKGLEVLGVRPGACVGQGLDAYSSSPAVSDHVRRALDGEALRAIVEEGGRAFDTWYAPLRDQHGAIAGVLGVAVDITERKRAEEERLAFEQLKAEFIANISHDLRTPLHHIKGYASLLLQHGAGLDAQTQQEFLQTITTATDRLNRLISDLIETARMTGGTLTLQRERVRIDTLVRSVVQRWQGISSHRFTMRSSTTVPPLLADPGRIEQVLDNVLTNVTRHTPDGTATEVDIQPMDEEVVVSVIDHGPGVASEHLPRLFDRFYQVEPQRDGQRRGSGLGLAICKWLVEQHGGRVWAEGTPGGGLTVRFSLPREP